MPRVLSNLVLAFGLYMGLTFAAALIESPSGWGSGVGAALAFTAYGTLMFGWIFPAMTLPFDLLLRVIPQRWAMRSRWSTAVAMALAVSLSFQALIALAVSGNIGDAPPRGEGAGLLDLIPFVLFPLAYGALVRLPGARARRTPVPSGFTKGSTSSGIA